MLKQNYDDILNTDWPLQTNEIINTHMPLKQRAKIFLPFAALKGYEQAIAEKQHSVIIAEENKNKGKIQFDEGLEF